MTDVLDVPGLAGNVPLSGDEFTAVNAEVKTAARAPVSAVLLVV